MRARSSTHIALFILASSVLILEVSLTRIFSVMLWSHYTFLVISTALLGFGAAGSALAIRGWEANESEVNRALSRNSLIFSISIVVSVMVVTNLELDSTKILVEPSATLKLVLIYAIMAIPFFFAGLAICGLLAAYASQINTIYFADLAGAGAGALAVTLLLSGIGAPATILVSCTLAAVAGWIFAGSTRHWICSAGIVAFGAATVVVFLWDPWTIPAAPTKPIRGLEDRIQKTRWSLHARIDVLDSRKRPLWFGSGVAEEFYGRRVAYRPFFMDGSNPSRMIERNQDDWFLQRVLTASPYGLQFQNPPVLVIGSGGGIDTMVARHHGAAHVTAIEINPATVDLVRNDFSHYIGELFAEPNVTLLAREGRHFVTLDQNTYDIIRLTGVDTKAASASGANSLDHAYIYTTEAIRDFYSHLTDGGVLAISRPSGWQTLRLISVMLRSLGDSGVKQLEDRFLVVSNGRWSDVLVRHRPLIPKEVDAFVRWAANSKMAVLYDPFTKRSNRHDDLIRAGPAAREELIRESAANLHPVTDDSPFFFEPQTLGTSLRKLVTFQLEEVSSSGYTILLLTLLQAIVFSSLFIFFPVAIGDTRATGVSARWWWLAYFCLLGLGFILVELVFLQKYMIVLGGPAYAMSITLFSILVFSGLGAYAAKRIPLTSRLPPILALTAVVLLLAGSAGFLRWGIPHLLGLDFFARVLVSIASLAPISFALGLPFPIGIRILDETSPELVPWAWAGNACLTVIGSVLCVIVSMNWGFLTALGVGAGSYIVAAMSLMKSISCEQRSTFPDVDSTATPDCSSPRPSPDPRSTMMP